MTRTMIDINDAYLEAAAEALGTSTTTDTVNQALADIAGRKQRLAFLDDLDAAAADLVDSKAMRGAWATDRPAARDQHPSPTAEI